MGKLTGFIENFKKSGTLIRMIFILQGCATYEIWTILILSVLSGLLPLLSVFAMLQMVKVIMLPKIDLVYFLVAISLMLLPNIFDWLISTIQGVLGERISTLASIKLGEEMKRKMTKIDFRYRECEECTNIVNRASSALDIGNLTSVLSQIPKLLSNLISTVSISILIISVNIYILPLLIILIYISYIIRKKAMSEMYESIINSTDNTRIDNEYFAHLTNMGRVLELKIFGGIKWMCDKWKEQHKICLNENKNRMVKFAYKQGASIFVATSLMQIISIAVLILMNTLSISNVIKVIQATKSLNLNITYIIVTLTLIQQVYETTRFYFEFIDIDKFVEEKYGIEQEGAVGITLHEVKFSYNEGMYAIKNINADIKPGEKIAIVGRNGSGKSTLIKNLLGIYKPSSGSIKYYDSKGVYPSGKRIRTSGLFQDYAIYKLTIREEIAISEIFNKNEDKQILEAAYAMGISDIVEKSGIDAQLGIEYGGVELSGGQWQRLALTRSMFKKNCGLLVFDEPMAALDAFAETRIINSFLNIADKSTAIFITHRLSSIAHVDRIFMMEDGEIKEIGTHKELMELKGKYFEMYNCQAKLYI